MPKDFDPGREYTHREAQDVTAALEAEQHRWLAAARAALCYAYQHDFENYRLTAKVVPTTRLCTHGRCDGVLDLVDRAMAAWRYNYPTQTGSGQFLRPRHLRELAIERGRFTPAPPSSVSGPTGKPPPGISKPGKKGF